MTCASIYRTGRGGVKVRAKLALSTRSENLIEVYEIPYTTTVEAILDKVAELIKAGKVREIADMRDETDLSGLKLAIDLKRGTDPDKLMQKLFRAHALAGLLRLQLQHPDRRDAPGAWAWARFWTSGRHGAPTASSGASSSTLRRRRTSCTC